MYEYQINSYKWVKEGWVLIKKYLFFNPSLFCYQKSQWDIFVEYKYEDYVTLVYEKFTIKYFRIGCDINCPIEEEYFFQ